VEKEKVTYCKHLQKQGVEALHGLFEVPVGKRKGTFWGKLPNCHEPANIFPFLASPCNTKEGSSLILRTTSSMSKSRWERKKKKRKVRDNIFSRQEYIWEGIPLSQETGYIYEIFFGFMFTRFLWFGGEARRGCPKQSNSYLCENVQSIYSEGVEGAGATDSVVLGLYTTFFLVLSAAGEGDVVRG
jgi:hypothetical protein